ncbi:hypothetical protein, partial [Paraburkholderia sp.]|uniref:hypothetical protein n=1 Tax=Paraburkholderia sp. TaxID=1926495 RepID=UPI002F40AF9C
GPHSASSAHTYRLLVFKDRCANRAAPQPPVPLRFTSLRLQQRSGIMATLLRFVNSVFGFA